MEKNYAEAAKWYRMAAEQGHAPSMNKLAYCYEYGYGVEVDLVTAIDYYKKAAAKGYEAAKKNLKRHGLDFY